MQKISKKSNQNRSNFLGAHYYPAVGTPQSEQRMHHHINQRTYCCQQKLGSVKLGHHRSACGIFLQRERTSEQRCTQNNTKHISVPTLHQQWARRNLNELINHSPLRAEIVCGSVGAHKIHKHKKTSKRICYERDFFVNLTGNCE
jgi:hypothetical protein